VTTLASLLLLLAAPPEPATTPEPPPATTPEPPPATTPADPKTPREAPPVPEREGYVDGEIPTTSPPGSRRGEQRQGELWRPITAPTYDQKQPIPSEDAVARQNTIDFGDAPAKGKRKQARYDSPQRFALELKFGPYLPDIDRNYSGAGFGPYATIYGETDDRGVATSKPKNGFYGGLAFEWQIVNLAGPIGIGVQWSMMRDKAQALLADPPTDPEADVRSGADSTRFAVMPVAVQAVYRFELLADRFRVPLVPYAKAGVNYSFWWSKDGSGDISTIKDADGKVIDKARGGAWGFQTNLGGMLRLDFLERGTARTLDRVTGINHTYLFAEWQLSRVNNFGRKNSINLGDSTWLVGLALEF
jgi:hypothetical protein